MSSRVLRKSRTRAAAKVVNYDEDVNESDDDDEPIMPPRKRATRSSTGRSAASMIRDTSPIDDPSPSLHPTPEPEAEIHPTGAENSTSGSIPGTPSETPSDLGPFKPAARKVRLRLGKSAKAPPPAKPIIDDDEDEDELADENDEEEDGGDGSSGSESEDEDEFGQSAGSTRAGVPLTARQAALAGLSAGSTLISLDQIEASRRKGPEKTEEELAAKRREAAKRRKQQLVQKTQAEKEGAVDRLLNKQAPRPRARRNQSGLNTATIGTPAGYATPVKGIGGADTRSASPDGDDNGEEEEEELPAPVIPTMLRWVSTSRGFGVKPSLIEEMVPANDGNQLLAEDGPVKDVDVDMNVASGAVDGQPSPEKKQEAVVAKGAGTNPLAMIEASSMDPGSLSGGGEEQTMELAFALCIPTTILEQLTANLPTDTAIARPRGPSRCGVTGCEAAKKYRVILSEGEEKGACGLQHFKMLKSGVIGSR